MKPIVIIQHDEADPPGNVGRYLTRAGQPYVVHDVGRGQRMPALDELSALIVLGGEMHTHEAQEFPFLAEERDLMSQCLQHDVPLLGICLGAQQLAVVAGGEVYKRPMPEVGWLSVDVIIPDPLMAGVPSSFVCLEWHDYSFRLPPGALRIAVRPDGEQVFRVGRRAWAVQFHPEVDEPQAEQWLAADERRLEDLRRGWATTLRAETQMYMPAYARFCGRLVGNFLEASGLVFHDRAG